MVDVLDIETRKNIYNLIKKNPGIHRSKISDMLHYKIQLVDYHLFYLESHGLISFVKEKGYKRCYIKGTVGIEDRRLLSLLRQPIPFEIILFLIKYPHSRHADILKHLNMSSGRFTYHLKKLLKKGIVTTSIKNEKTVYTVQNEKEFIQLLIKYKPITRQQTVKDIWDDFK